MSDAEKMGKLATEVGAGPVGNDTGQRGPGRTPGAVLEFVSPKGKGSKWLEKEIYKHRREIRELREKAGKATADGSSSETGVPAFPPELWGILPAIGYDYLAGRFGDYWRLSEPEVKQWGAVTEKCVNRYLGEYVSANPELAALVMVATVTTVPRALKLWKDGGKRAADENGGSSGSDGSRATGDGKNDLRQKAVRESS